MYRVRSRARARSCPKIAHTFPTTQRLEFGKLRPETAHLLHCCSFQGRRTQHTDVLHLLLLLSDEGGHGIHGAKVFQGRWSLLAVSKRMKQPAPEPLRTTPCYQCRAPCVIVFSIRLYYAAYVTRVGNMCVLLGLHVDSTPTKFSAVLCAKCEEQNRRTRFVCGTQGL